MIINLIITTVLRFRITGEFDGTGNETLLFDGPIQPLPGSNDQLSSRTLSIPVLITNSSGSDYFLRVYARDSSGNEALASNTVTVYVPGRSEPVETGSPILPTWLFWTLIGLGILILIVLALITMACCYKKMKSNQDSGQVANWIKYGESKKNKNSIVVTSTSTPSAVVPNRTEQQQQDDNASSIEWSEASSYISNSDLAISNRYFIRQLSVLHRNKIYNFLFSAYEDEDEVVMVEPVKLQVTKRTAFNDSSSISTISQSSIEKPITINRYRLLIIPCWKEIQLFLFYIRGPPNWKPMPPPYPPPRRYNSTSSSINSLTDASSLQRSLPLASSPSYFMPSSQVSDFFKDF